MPCVQCGNAYVTEHVGRRTAMMQDEHGKSKQTLIMIVDDDAALGEMLSIVLNGSGFETVTCQDGLRAVEMFPTLHPDLVLLDIMLPGLDGVQVAQRIRQTANTPIIMLTAKSDTTDVVKGLEPFAPVFPNRCHSAVFPVFPTVPAWFAIHSNSLQFTAITGRVWAKCGHGIRDTCAVAHRLRPRRFPPACR